MHYVVIITENFLFLDSLDPSLVWSHPSLASSFTHSLGALLVSTPISVSFSFCFLLLRRFLLIFAPPKVCSFISWFRSFVSRKQKQSKGNGVSYCFRSRSHWCQLSLREGDIEGAVSFGGEFLRLRGRGDVWFRGQWGLHPALSECSSEVSGPAGKAGGAPWGAPGLPGVLSPQGSVNDRALRAAASRDRSRWYPDGTHVGWRLGRHSRMPTVTWN